MWRGRVAAEGRLNLSLGPLGLAIYESKKCQPQAQTCLKGLRDVSPSLG